MGKLSKIRRDIINNPEKYKGMYRGATVAKNGKVYNWYSRSHKAFIKKVLANLAQQVEH